MNALLYVGLAILVGMGLSIEAGLLGPLGQQVGHLWATFSIFSVGAALLGLAVLIFDAGSASFNSAPSWQKVGGILGPVYVVVLTWATPVVGVGATMVAILFGQIAQSVLIDQFGWFQSVRKRLNVYRMTALLLIFTALIFLMLG